MNGLEEGRKDGLELGKEIARKMKKTNFEVQTIKEMIGLTQEEIEKL